MRCAVQRGWNHEEKRSNLETLDTVGREWTALVRKEQRCLVHTED